MAQDNSGRHAERAMGWAIKELVSRHARFRGDPPLGDSKLTLLTVNWHTQSMLSRLVRSFRVFGDSRYDVVVVDNSSRTAPADLQGLAAKRVTAGVNLGHGLGLDFGMRWVSTEYTLVCDPDTAVLSHCFFDQLWDRLDKYGVAAMDTGNPYYHPLGVAFRTEHWKRGGFSFLHRWPYWDTGGELTHLLGGVIGGALVPKSRSFGPALPAMLGGGGHHFLGEVYGEAFASTYLAARLVAEPERQDFDGWPRGLAVSFHEAWLEWLDCLLGGTATVDDFPSELT